MSPTLSLRNSISSPNASQIFINNKKLNYLRNERFACPINVIPRTLQMCRSAESTN